MKVLSILASPKKNGNTAALLNSFLKGAEDEGNVILDEIFLTSKNIHPCTACDYCQKNDIGKCIIKDDMQEIYNQIKESDAIIFATPVYWWNMSSYLKIFIDRLYAVMTDENNPPLKGKKAVLLMTYGGELPNSGPEIVERSIRESSDYLGMNVQCVLGICSSKPVSSNKEALSKAYELGKQIRL